MECVHHRGCKIVEIGQARGTDEMHDLPVNGFVIMYRQVMETDRFFQAGCEIDVNPADLGQRIESPAHRDGRGNIGEVRNPVRRNIDA